MAVGEASDLHMLPGCLTPLLTLILFKPQTTLLMCASAEVRGKSTPGHEHICMVVNKFVNNRERKGMTGSDIGPIDDGTLG